MSPAIRRRALFAMLYLTEGAPIGFLWWLLPARLRLADVPVAEIGSLVAALALPWALKFLWAPLLDVWRFGYRRWMLGAQVVMAASLLPIGWLDLVADFPLVFALCVTHAVAAATQDVAIDALAIEATPPDERGAVNGWMQAGMLAGRAAFGGLALAWAENIGLAPVVGMLSAVVLAVGVVAARSPLLSEPPPSGVRLGDLRRLLPRGIRTALLFALVAGAGFEAVGGLASPFLVDRGYVAEDIGYFLGLAAVSCMVAGALIGGRVADRAGARRAAAGFLMLLALSIVPVATLGGGRALFLSLGAFYFAIGLFTASSYAMFMNLAVRGWGATQFTACMAMTNLCESWSVFTASRLVDDGGYRPAFLAMALVSLAGLAFLPRACDTSGA